MTNKTQRTTPGRWAGVAALVAVLGLAGCDIDSLLDVNDPDTVNPQSLEDPEVLDVVIAGALGDFTRGYSGEGGDAFISVVGVFTDELYSSGTFPTREATDRRTQRPPDDGNTSDGAYVNLQFARRALNDAAARVAEVRGTDEEDYAELKAKEGYTLVALAEGFCPAIPLSRVAENGDFVFGQPLSGAQVLDTAIVRFNAAMADVDSDLARVGKARALVDLGRYDEAAALVPESEVPTTFVHYIFHSVTGASNPIFSLQANGRYSVSDNEGQNGLPFRSADDPRNPWFQDPDGGFDAGIPLFITQKYSDFVDPVVLASGVEARLIQAEAELNRNNFVAMNLILNDLRSQADVLVPLHVTGDPPEDPDLAPLPVPLNRNAAIDQLFFERAFWLYLTGHRLGDLRRLIYQYGRTEDQVYPTGEYFKGDIYGDDVVFPLDFDETNNEFFTLDMCNTRSAGITG